MVEPAPAPECRPWWLPDLPDPAPPADPAGGWPFPVPADPGFGPVCVGVVVVVVLVVVAAVDGVVVVVVVVVVGAAVLVVVVGGAVLVVEVGGCWPEAASASGPGAAPATMAASSIDEASRRAVLTESPFPPEGRPSGRTRDVLNEWRVSGCSACRQPETRSPRSPGALPMRPGQTAQGRFRAALSTTGG